MQMMKRAFQVEELNESRKRGKKILICTDWREVYFGWGIGWMKRNNGK